MAKKKSKKATSVAIKRSDARGYAMTASTTTTTTTKTTAASQRTMIRATTTNSSTTATTTKTTTTTMAITATVHQTLEDLLQLLLLRNDDERYGKRLSSSSSLTLPQLQPPAVNTRAFYQKMGQIYDHLTVYGFTLDQIRMVVTAIGGSQTTTTTLTITTALDWLCLHVPTPDLPPLFTEGLVRDATATTMTSSSTNNAAQQLTIIPAAVTRKHSNNEPKRPPTDIVNHDNVLKPGLKAADSSIDDDDEARKDDSSSMTATHKAWLIQQYQYEEDDDDDDDAYTVDEHVSKTTMLNALVSQSSSTMASHEEARLIQQYQYVEEEGDKAEVDGAGLTDEVLGGNVQAAIVTTITSTSDTLLFNDTRQDSEWDDFAPYCELEEDDADETVTNNGALILPDDSSLQAMKAQLKELEADAGNEASNYMRSKQEIKEMKNQVKNMRQQVEGLERKLQRQQRKAEPNIIAATKLTEKSGTPGVDDDIDDVGGLLSMFESKITTNALIGTNVPAGVHIPENSIPHNWTGKSPKTFLEEWCRTQKASKPIFQKLALNGCFLQVKDSKGVVVEVEERGPNDSYKDVQHYVAVKALYQINPTLPLYRLFPPFYRDLWLGWLDEKQKVKQDQNDFLADQRRETIDELIRCIPRTTLTDTIGAVQQHNEEKFPLPESRLEKKPVDNDKRTGATNGMGMGMNLKHRFLRRQESSKYQAMLLDRMNLPIYAFREEILETIRKSPVTILCAETGSGKTTQCASYILEQALGEGRGDHTSILCTQPRRVAAISVAERVADELGDDSIGKLVGYQIRMESRRSADTRLLFCTTGVILRRLIEDPTLKGISHVVVDEVHERQWQIDVLLVSLRAMLNGARPDLKIILMSATLDTKLFGTFFCGSPIVNVPGRTYPVSTFYLEDVLEETNHIIEEGSRYARRDYNRDRETISMSVTSRGGEKRRETADYQLNEDVSDKFPGFSLATRKSLDRVDETVINYDLIEDVLTAVLREGTSSFTPFFDNKDDGANTKVSASGSVLVFLPGIGEIRTLAERLSGSRFFGNSQRFEIVPLHSTLSSIDQKRAFKTSPIGCRKIIVSTNIAETSITIPDVVYVVDCGRVREIRRDKKTGTRKLVATWCSRASAKQRAGRAGRVQSGVCIKLYSSLTESEVMTSASEPEIRRIPLEEVCLTILAGGFAKNCADFLSQTPQPPSEDAVLSALKILEDIGAISLTTVPNSSRHSIESLTGLGLHLAKLPVDARIGKMLIFGAVFKCIDTILTIAASLSASKSPFASSYDNGQQVKAAHAQFSHPFSDFFTLVNVSKAFRQASISGTARKLCRESFLNYSALIEIEDARQRYMELLCGLGFVDRTELGGDSRKKFFDERKLAASKYCSNSCIEDVVHSVICAGLYPNVAKLTRTSASGEVTVTHKTERLYIHSSVNSKLPPHIPSNWITYFEKFGTERRVSISKTAFVSPFCLMIFCSKLQVLHTERKVLIDDWIELPAAAKSGIIFREIRDGLNDLLTWIIEDSHSSDRDSLLSSWAQDVITMIVKLLSQNKI